jgi:hypothetical protein
MLLTRDEILRLGRSAHPSPGGGSAHPSPTGGATAPAATPRPSSSGGPR